MPAVGNVLKLYVESNTVCSFDSCTHTSPIDCQNDSLDREIYAHNIIKIMISIFISSLRPGKQRNETMTTTKTIENQKNKKNMLCTE